MPTTSVRLSLAALSLTATACTDTPAPEPVERPPVAAPATAFEPGPRHRPPVKPEGCVEGTGLRPLGTAGMDSLRDVAISPRGEVSVAGDENGRLLIEGGVFGATPLIATFRPDLSDLVHRSPATAPVAGFGLSLATAPDGRLWFSAVGAGDTLLGDVQDDGTLRVVAHVDDPGGRETARALRMGPTGQVAVVGVFQQLVDGMNHVRPLLWTGSLAQASAGAMVRTPGLLDQHEIYPVVDVGLDRLVVGADVNDGPSPGLRVGLRELDGRILWERQVSTSAGDEIVAVAQLPDGDVVWVASTSEALGGPHRGGTDVVIGRLDADTGAPVWATQYGTSGDDRAADVAVRSDGRLFVAAGLAAPAGDADVAVIGFDDADGHPTYLETWGSAGSDLPTALAIDPCGTLAIVGTTNGDLAGPPRGWRDAFLLVTRTNS